MIGICKNSIKIAQFHNKFKLSSEIRNVSIETRKLSFEIRISMKFYEFRAIPIEIKKFSIEPCKFFDSNSKFAFGTRKFIIEIRKIQFEIKIWYNSN